MGELLGCVCVGGLGWGGVVEWYGLGGVGLGGDNDNYIKIVNSFIASTPGPRNPQIEKCKK